jgi:hypothetical protein
MLTTAPHTTMGDGLRTWTVEDVVEDVCSWLELIGLGHKNDLVREGKIDGSTLCSATEEDLMSMGFAKLQAKKMMKTLGSMQAQSTATSATPVAIAQPVSNKNTVVAPRSISVASSTEDALRREIADLKSLVTALTTKVEANAYKSTSHSGVPANVVAVNFCGGSYIEGNEMQMLNVTMRPGDIV